MTQTHRFPVAPTTLVVAAFAAVYLIWGSTYLAIRFAIESLPPFLMAATRFLLAGAVLYGVVRLRGAPRPSLAQWRGAAVVGSLMLLGGNGLVCWAEQTVPSGAAALMIATVPLWMVLLEWLAYRGARPTFATALGLLIGLGGVYLLIGRGNFGGKPIDAMGGVALLAACAFWSLGSLYSRRATLPRSALMATAMEMVTGGAACLIAGTLAGEWPSVNPAAVSLKSLLALGYLIVFGAIVALSAYVWLLQVSTPARVSTYAYVNPVIAVLLGALLANEPLTWRVIGAAAVIVTAVLLITRGSRPVLERPAAPVAAPALSIEPEADNRADHAGAVAAGPPDRDVGHDATASIRAACAADGAP